MYRHSFFDEQDGDFSLELRSIAAAKTSHEHESEDEEMENVAQEKEMAATAGNSARHSRWSWKGVFCGLL